MKDNFETSLDLVLRSEGYEPDSDTNPYGYVNDPHDPGGMTQLGVTKRAWEDYVGHPVSEDDMKALRPDTVSQFYREKYWDSCQCDMLPAGVDYCVMDFAVNSGPGRASRLLQEVVGVTKQDGVIGPLTLDAVSLMTPTMIITELSDARTAYLQSLSTFDRYGRGWLNRVSQVERAAFAMVSR